jgi:hypothetical protein
LRYPIDPAVVCCLKLAVLEFEKITPHTTGWSRTKIKQKKMQNKEKQQLIGWCLFILSASFYIASSIKIKDILSLLGGLFFLFTCIVFVKDLLSHK